MDPLSADSDDRPRDLLDVILGLRALVFETDRLAQCFAADHGLSGSDFRALLHVVDSENVGDPLTASDLRHRLNVSAGAVTYIVDRLVRAGHVRRETDERDRRKVNLHYSESGHRLTQQYFRPIAQHYRVALEGVPDADLEVAKRVLETLVEAARSLPGWDAQGTT